MKEMKHILPVATWFIKPVEPLFAICEGAWLSPGEGVPNRGNCWELISTCKTSHSFHYYQILKLEPILRDRSIFGNHNISQKHKYSFIYLKQ